jgi:hypothetical protein
MYLHALRVFRRFISIAMVLFASFASLPHHSTSALKSVVVVTSITTTNAHLSAPTFQTLIPPSQRQSTTLVYAILALSGSPISIALNVWRVVHHSSLNPNAQLRSALLISGPPLEALNSAITVLQWEPLKTQRQVACVQQEPFGTLPPGIAILAIMSPLTCAEP